MLIDQIKARMLEALKGRRTLEKEILGVALGELQTVEARKGTLSDEEAAGIVRKLIKSNRETLEASSSAEQRAALEQEIVVLEALLPKSLGAEELALVLAPVRDAIRAAAGDGQATGIAMKLLKTQGTVVDGKLVGEVVKKIRA
jgi:uncharacterized protein YqeY